MFSSISRNLFKKAVNTNRLTYTALRGIKLHEYQAAKLLQSFDVPVPYGDVAFTPEEAKDVGVQFEKDNRPGYVVKAQILGGGRGRGYFKENDFQKGVHLVNSPDEIQDVSSKMVGYSLVTKQSGPEGMPCKSVYIVEKLNILSEMYLAFTLDRLSSMPVLVYSPEGGMAIEDVAEATPEKIFKAHVDINTGFTDAQIDEICENLSLNEYKESATKTLKNLFKCFTEKDSDMVEINPMVVDKNYGVLCADSKITIDDNAAFRQKDLAEIEDKSDISKNEVIAEKYHLNYIPIGGNIGCLVNGAGLAMATMDILNNYGGSPANFLDVGGGAVGEQMNQAINMLCNDETVNAIFINIFGGILRCDLLVQSILEANEKNPFTKPIVLRLNGSKAEEAKEMIKGKEEELGIQFEADFDKAAQLAVKVAKEASS